MVDLNNANKSHKLRISIGDKNLGKVLNKNTTWGKLIEKMASPLVDVQHTLEQYLKLSVDRQGELKNVGFFVGGHCDNGVRRIDSVKERYVITLDVDACTPGHVDDLTWGMTDLSKYEFFVYSTRKHTSKNPRIRIIIPLEKPCDAEAYHALTRIVAEKFDSTMESVDPVSYRATQLMYWPSVCKDAEFLTFHNPGELLNPIEVLEEFGDWRDHTKLPRSERDDSRFNAAGKKPEDPETKEGLVGAFCRAYDVPAAIDEFLPEIYIDPIESGQGTRYTFAKGTTAHGAIVYDDGKFLYSNHMHDPASGHSQNAFDLVRLHLFGDLDKKAKDGTTPMALPSTKAMLDRLKDDSAVTNELREKNYDLNSMFRDPVDDEEVFDDLGEVAEVDDDYDPDLEGPRSTNSDTEWFEQLDVNSEGVVKPTFPNLTLIVSNDPRLKGAIRYNLFTSKAVYMREMDGRQFNLPVLPNTDPVNGSSWTDSHTRVVKMMIESPRGKDKPGYGLRISKMDLEDAIDISAQKSAFHPVKSYLESLTWDGKQRAEKVFVEYLGAENNGYHREVCRLTLLAAVTRIFEPGHKFDYMPILEGAQGKRKSTFVKTLAKNWFSEMGNFDDRNRAIESMTGSWILEFAELHQLSRNEVTKAKEFLSTTTDHSRLAYERHPRTFSRQCVFIGTTNESEYLKDQTGNRRFWPVKCLVSEINIDKLTRNIDQIWAEVVQMYRDERAKKPFGELPLYLVDEQAAELADELQHSRKAESPEQVLAVQIQSWLDKPSSKDDVEGKFVTEYDPFEDNPAANFYRNTTCSSEIYEKLLGKDRKNLPMDKMAQYQISKAMQLISGWSRSQKQGRHGSYGKQYVLYVRENPKIYDDEL